MRGCLRWEQWGLVLSMFKYLLTSCSVSRSLVRYSHFYPIRHCTFKAKHMPCESFYFILCLYDVCVSPNVQAWVWGCACACSGIHALGSACAWRPEMDVCGLPEVDVCCLLSCLPFIFETHFSVNLEFIDSAMLLGWLQYGPEVCPSLLI